MHARITLEWGLPSRMVKTTSTTSLQRASSLFEWLTDSDMRLVNTFMDEDTGRITTTDDWNTGSPSQIDFVISSSSLVCVDTGVDEHMDFATDHRPVWANFHFAAPTLGPKFLPQRVPRAPRCRLETWLWIACIGTGDSTGGRAHSPRFAWTSLETDSHGFVLVYGCMAE